MDIRFIILVMIMIISVINDYKTRRIKNVVPTIMIITGIGLNFIYQDINILFSLLISIAYFICLFFIPRVFRINEFMGAGDIKLYMAISFLMGWKFSLYVFLYSIFIGAIILLIFNLRRVREIGLNIIMFFALRGKWEIDEAQEKTNMFTVYILIGCLIEYFFHYDWLFEQMLQY